MKRLSVPAMLLAFLITAFTGGMALAQDPAPPGPPGPQGPPGPSGTTFFGVDQNTALLIGGLILVLIVILAIVSISNKGARRV